MESERLAKLEQWKVDHIHHTDQRFDRVLNQNKEILRAVKDNQSRLNKLETDILMYTRIVLWTGVSIGAIGGLIIRYWENIHHLLHKAFP